MLKWLKKKLRNWLLEEDSLSLELEASIGMDNNFEKGTAVKVAGPFVHCLFKDGSEHLVGESHARDKEHFQKVWRYLSK